MAERMIKTQDSISESSTILRQSGCLKSCLITICLGTCGVVALAWLGLNNLHQSRSVLLIRSDHEVEVVGSYMGWACGGFTPDIRPIDSTIETIPVRKEFSGLAFHVPPGLLAPDQIDALGVPGNKFLVQGFYYYALVKGKKVLHNRFDLTAWQMLAPYERWTGGSPPKETIYRTRSLRSYWWEYLKPYGSFFRAADKYDYDCF